MKRTKSTLRTDTEAVSHVIGVVLMIAIFVTLFTIMQATVVPDWNKKEEASQLTVAYNDMMFLPSDIEDVALLEAPKSFTIPLGTWYSDKILFRNMGPGAAGSLTIEEPTQVTVTYTNASGTPTKRYNTSRITYELTGMINSPKLVYEHGAIITDWGTVNLTTDEQTLIANDNIYVPIVSGLARSKSGMGAESLVISPYEYNDTINRREEENRYKSKELTDNCNCSI